MPIIDPDQGIDLVDLADLANNQAAFANFWAGTAGGVKSRVILRYPSRAARAAQHPTPLTNEMSIIDGETWYERWTGTKWLPATPIQAFKTASETVNNSTALQNDNELLVPIPAVAANWRIEGVIYYASTTVADLKATFAVNGGISSLLFGLQGLATGSAGVTGDTNWDSQVPGVAIAIGGTGGTISATISGGMISTGVAGTLQFQWAQNTAEATNTQISSRSWLSLTGIS